jgi:hypothetical protein
MGISGVLTLNLERCKSKIKTPVLINNIEDKKAQYVFALSKSLKDIDNSGFDYTATRLLLPFIFL